MTPPSMRPEVCPARTEPGPPFVDVAADSARSSRTWAAARDRFSGPLNRTAPDEQVAGAVDFDHEHRFASLLGAYGSNITGG
jgi:hypothetical protein